MSWDAEQSGADQDDAADRDVDIVVGVDGSLEAEAALRWAVHAARPLGARVRAVLVWAPAGPSCPGTKPPAPTSPEHPRWTAQWLLRETVQRVRADVPDARILEQAVFGPPVQRLLAESDHAAMLVVGARGSGENARMLTGSVSLACAHGACVPVVVVHGAPARRAGDRDEEEAPVVVGVDGSQGSADALVWAARAAVAPPAPLWVVHVGDEALAGLAARLGVGGEEFRRAARGVLDDSMREAGLAVAGAGGLVDVRGDVLVGNVAEQLTDVSADARLLVVGARGRGGFADLQLGSTSAQCVQHAACPVAVIRPPRSAGAAN
jgi:nucleotide-binding universal stress UspA family protein